MRIHCEPCQYCFIRWLLVLVILGVAPVAQCQDPVLRTLLLEDGSSLQYAELLPAGYEGSEPVPVLLAMPPGNQSKAMVERGLDLYWKKLVAHGWVVISPVRPGSKLFFQGAEKTIPELLDRIEATVSVEGGRFHLAGVSNGGRSAFRIALRSPDRFASLTVLPGFPPEAADFKALSRLQSLPVALFGGSLDRRWVAEMQRTRDRLEGLGADVHLTVYPNEGHVPESLAKGDVLLDLLQSRRSSERKSGAGHPDGR